MSDDRIERALRQGPPGEPAYMARLTPADLHGSVATTPRSKASLGGLAGLANTVVAAGLLVAVVGIVLIRSGTFDAGGKPPAIPTLFEIVGRYSATELGLDGPIGLAIGPNGDAYVTESVNRVSQISPDGTVVRRWGTEGSNAGEFDFVAPGTGGAAYGSIAVAPNGIVYVSDSQNRRVQVFTAEGTFVRQFGTFGAAAGQLTLPFDLSVDASGNVYVLDDTLMRLTKFDPNGGFVWLADATTDPALEGHGHDADIDSRGRIVVGNDGNGQVVYLDPDGNVVDAFSAGACNVTIDSADNTYISNAACGGDLIQVYDPAHVLIGSWSGPEMILAAPPQFGPNGEILALDRDGGIVRLKVTLPRII